MTYRYTSEERAKIGRYALLNGVAAAARHFSRKLSIRLSESTVRSIKDAYKVEVNRKRKQHDDNDVSSLPVKKRGRSLLIGEDLDSKVQLYLKNVRNGGGVVSSRIAMAAARGVLLSYDKYKLAEFGGHVVLNRHWAYSLLKRMKYAKRKATTAKSKYTGSDFKEAKKNFLDEVVTTVRMEAIPPELILNWDQTGIKIVPSSTWTMDQRGSKRVEMKGVDDKRQITAVFCGTLTGDFLPVQLIYKGKTSRCHPKLKLPSGWHVTHSPKHWSTEETMIQYIEHIILPYLESARTTENAPALIIMDNFKGQVTPSINRILEENNIHVCLLPPNTTDLLQPMDISVNKPAKEFLRNEFQQWYSEQVQKRIEEEGVDAVEITPIKLEMPILKELGVKWLIKMAEYLADNPQFIVNGFRRAGILGALDGIDESDEQSEGHGSDEDSETEIESNEDSETQSEDSETESSDDSEEDSENFNFFNL